MKAKVGPQPRNPEFSDSERAAMTKMVQERKAALAAKDLGGSEEYYAIYFNDKNDQ